MKEENLPRLWSTSLITYGVGKEGSMKGNQKETRNQKGEGDTRRDLFQVRFYPSREFWEIGQRKKKRGALRKGQNE